MKDTRTPVAVGIGTVILNIILNIWLVKPMGHSGLALAYSLVGMVNMMLLILLLKKKIGSVDGKKITMSALGSSLAALVTGVVAYTVVTLLESILVLRTRPPS